MTASILQQLLALYFAILYSWLLSSREKSLFRKKHSSIYFKDFTDLDFFYTDIFFFIFFYAKRMLYSEQPIVLLARRHLNTMLLTNFENLNSISNLFQETHDFFVLTDPLIICIYLGTTDRHFRGLRNVRHSTLKLLKCDLVQKLSTFRKHSLRIFAAGKRSLVLNTPLEIGALVIHTLHHGMKPLGGCDSVENQ